jgi:hypothetical protein
MRPILLLPLAIIALAGCGTDEAKQTASLPARNLALPTQYNQVEIASPLELGRPEVRPVARPARRSARRSKPAAPRIEPVATIPDEPVAVRAVPAIFVPSSSPSIPASDRELPPGKTVTIIPASSGPSPNTDVADGPAPGGHTMVHGGGTCRPGRGRGPIGIATAPRPDFR